MAGSMPWAGKPGRGMGCKDGVQFYALGNQTAGTTDLSDNLPHSILGEGAVGVVARVVPERRVATMPQSKISAKIMMQSTSTYARRDHSNVSYRPEKKRQYVSTFALVCRWSELTEPALAMLLVPLLGTVVLTLIVP